MKDVKLFTICLLIGFGMTVGYLILKTISSQSKPVLKKQTMAPAYLIESPPSDSLKGSIISRSGILFWESRIATAPSELKTNVQIEQGEEIITQDKSDAAINFDNFGSLFLSENSDISFIQTLPIDFVVEQKKGKIEYSVNDKTPLSIRIRNVLVTKTSGKIRITITEDDPVILISTLLGTAKIGFNDLDNISQFFTLREGQIYEYNSDHHTAINSKNK